MTAETSSAVRSPKSRYTRAALTSGLSPCDTSCTHCAAESARWSNWPGRYSTANTGPLCFGSPSYTLSRGGSENTVGTQAKSRSAPMFSTS